MCRDRWTLENLPELDCYPWYTTIAAHVSIATISLGRFKSIRRVAPAILRVRGLHYPLSVNKCAAVGTPTNQYNQHNQYNRERQHRCRSQNVSEVIVVSQTVLELLPEQFRGWQIAPRSSFARPRETWHGQSTLDWSRESCPNRLPASQSPEGDRELTARTGRLIDGSTRSFRRESQV